MMRQRIAAVWITVAIMVAGASSADVWAASNSGSSTAKRYMSDSNIIYLNPLVGVTRYEEPGLMENKGVMGGFEAGWTHWDWFMFDLSARWMYGRVDYNSTNTGTVGGLTDQMYEVRTLFGYPLRYKKVLRFTPYIGLAYRYLSDDSSGKRTSTGHWGYKRESNYYYSPVGAKIEWAISKRWVLGAHAEYDLFWNGRQISHLSDVDPNYSDASNNQNSGYGIRGGLPIMYCPKRSSVRWVLEPYAHYWNVSESNISVVTYRNTPVALGVEPDNKTLEVGVKIGIWF
ncbi:MAG TPA: autotransporter outer membrane beta-barrel domain-containing protein [Methanothrix sp.]|nr:autotransporter outer membrane beta-barrel domain-containing protein [Methanothrix sp.]HOK59207.1 autotransporter outer membrane beta-barrel domain-containing protein [Methanothrix sp.]HOL44664.1 autotransporter outer membrane beta-barrel domain-containing protein [Methanothrix sp.]HPO89435.1 autotransporter outer membrane beta-barrel domain-containing protein [Methanothrix sp.]